MSTIEREVQVVPEVLTEREQRARILEAAALEIEVRGWTTGECKDPSGAVCLLGGIAFALGVQGDPDDDVSDWDSFAAPFGGPIFPCGHFENRSVADSLYSWNDCEARSADEVTFLLRWRAEEIRDGR